MRFIFLLSLLVISSGFGISNVYALSHDMVCLEYNPGGSCKSAMRESDWREATDAQYNVQVMSTLVTIIIVPVIIIIFIAVIVSSVKKSQKNKQKTKQTKIKKQEEFEKEQRVIKQEQEKEIHELKEKVDRLEKNNNSLNISELEKNDTDMEIEELEKKIQEEHNGKKSKEPSGEKMHDFKPSAKFIDDDVEK